MLLFLGVILFAANLASAQTFFDGTFDLANWNTTFFNGFGTVSQEDFDGNPDEFFSTAFSTDGSSFISLATSIRADFSIDPSIAPIASIGFSFDARAIQLDNAELGISLAIEQGGVQYVTPVSDEGFFVTESTWVNVFGQGLTESDFNTFGDGPPIPDFSISGLPISFGFSLLQSNPALIQEVIGGIDNYAVTVSLVPEPSGGVLLFTTSGLVVLLRRRNSRFAQR
jgi:hypothetical protein